MTEIELSVLPSDLPDRVADRVAMARHVGGWKGRRSREGAKADWQFTTANARVKLRKLYPKIDV